MFIKKKKEKKKKEEKNAPQPPLISNVLQRLYMEGDY